MSNEEIIDEILHEASELKIRAQVIEIFKKITDTNPKMDRVDAMELAFNHVKKEL